MALNSAQKIELAEEMTHRKALDNMHRARAQLENKHKYTGLNRYLTTQKNEIDEETQREEKKGELAVREETIAREQKLAHEMAKMKRDEYNEMRLRQILRETSPELKELERRLKQAYCTKILKQQIEEKEMEKLREQIKTKEVHNLLNEARVLEDEHHVQMKEKEIHQKLKYKQELQDQMIHQEITKKFQYEEFLKEKKFIDDLVQRIHEEDEREQYNKYCKMLRTQEEIIAFKQAQEIWRARSKKQIEEEDRKIKEFIREKIKLEQKRQADKEFKEAIKAKISDEMGKKIYQERRKEEEKLQIILELNEEEQKEAFDRKQKEKIEKELRSRLETLSVLHEQMREKKEKERQEAVQDAAYKEQLIAKIAEDNRIEQLTKEKRRLKMLQIRRDVEETILENRRKKAEEMQIVIKDEENRRAELEKRRKLIECERIRLLREHAENLIGFLPPDLLKEESDFGPLQEQRGLPTPLNFPII